MLDPTPIADAAVTVFDGSNETELAWWGAGIFAMPHGLTIDPGEFDLPHAVAIDVAGRVYVADRNNDRVQIFDAGGRFLDQWSVRSPYDIAFAPDGTAFIVDGEALLVVTPTGSVVERLGGFVVAHAVAVGENGAVYVADIEALT